jgi:hypothetical protein
VRGTTFVGLVALLTLLTLGAAGCAIAWGSTEPSARAQWLTNLYTEQEIRAFERAGDYLGLARGDPGRRQVAHLRRR